MGIAFRSHKSDFNLLKKDLGNLMADSQGKIDVTFKDEMAGLVGQYSIAGRAFVVSGYHNTSQLIFLIFNRNFTET